MRKRTFSWCCCTCSAGTRTGEPIPSESPFHQYESRGRAYIFTEEGQLRDTLDLDVENIAPLGGFLDRNRIFLDGACYDLRTHRQEWSLAEGQTEEDSVMPCHLHGAGLPCAIISAVPGVREGGISPPSCRTARSRSHGSFPETAVSMASWPMGTGCC